LIIAKRPRRYASRYFEFHCLVKKENVMKDSFPKIKVKRFASRYFEFHCLVKKENVMKDSFPKIKVKRLEYVSVKMHLQLGRYKF